MRWLLVGLLLFVLTPHAKAQSGAHDKTLEYLQNDRAAFGNATFFFGDSIARGYALHQFPDEATASDIASPLWPLNSPASMMNFLLRASGVSQVLDDTGHPTSGNYVATYAGAALAPEVQPTQDAAKSIENLAAQHVIRRGDVIVLEDAGDHGDDLLAYKNFWKVAINAAARTGAKVLVLNVFDAGPGIGLTGVDLRLYSYHTTFRMPDNSLSSFNDMIADAVSELDFPNVTFIDIDTAMRYFTYKTRAIMPSQVTYEGVHPNILGQCVMVSLVARESKVLEQEIPWGSLAALLEDEAGRGNVLAAPFAKIANGLVQTCANIPLDVVVVEPSPRLPPFHH